MSRRPQPGTGAPPGSAGLRPPLFDIVLAACVPALCVLLVVRFPEHVDAAGVEIGSWLPLLLAGQFLPLLWRRHRPEAALFAALAAHVGYIAATRHYSPISALTEVVLVYTVATVRPSARSCLVAAGYAAGTTAVTMLDPADVGWWGHDLAAVVVWTSMIWGVGVSVREFRAWRRRGSQRRAILVALADERLRIAQELDDVVAHHVSGILVQAGAARSTLTGRPELAAEALGRVEGEARQALTAMRGVLGLLRSSRPQASPSRPQASPPGPALTAAPPSTGPSMVTPEAPGLGTARTDQPGEPGQPGDSGGTGDLPRWADRLPARAGALVGRALQHPELAADPGRPPWPDVLFAAGLTIGSLVAWGFQPVPGAHWSGAVCLALLVCVPVAWRTRWPLAAWGVAAVAWQIMSGYGTSRSTEDLLAVDLVHEVAFVLLVYTLASRRPWRLTLPIMIGYALVNWTITALRYPKEMWYVGNPGYSPAAGVGLTLLILVLTFPVFSYTAGVLVSGARRRRARRRAEAIKAERLRLARDLHDEVAHHVSGIVVQAGAARSALSAAGTRPAAVELAEAALGAVEKDGRATLAAMGKLVGVLVPGHRDPAEPLGSQPSLDQVDELVERAGRAGLAVRLRVEGTVRPLPAKVDLFGYRVVQEALTNIRKHAGPARVEVTVRYVPGAVELDVLDNGGGGRTGGAVTGGGPGLAGGAVTGGAGPPGGQGAVTRGGPEAATRGGPDVGPDVDTSAPGGGVAVDGDIDEAGAAGMVHGGLGLIGMRERVALLGGTLRYGPRPVGGWRVHALLPTGEPS